MTYLLISTDFIRTSQKVQKLGPLNDYAKLVEEHIKIINNMLLNIVATVQTVITEISDSFYNYIRYIDDSTNNIFELFSKNIMNLIKIEHKEILKIINRESEEIAIKKNMWKTPLNKILVDYNFRAIILNYHFISQPYLHIMFTILKYDIIKKKYYVDLFVTTTEYIKTNSIKNRQFIPKMSNEYATISYEILKKDIEDINLINSHMKNISNYIQRENGIVPPLTQKFNLQIQKSVVQYLKGNKPINDDERKNLFKTLPTNYIRNEQQTQEYKNIIDKIINIATQQNIFESKNYTVIATSKSLLKNNIIYEKCDTNDNNMTHMETHAETQLIKNCLQNQTLINDFKTHDTIYIVRLYNDYTVRCGVPCNECIHTLRANGIVNVIFSIDTTNCRYFHIDTNTQTYTTLGNKLYYYDEHLYEIYTHNKRTRTITDDIDDDV